MSGDTHPTIGLALGGGGVRGLAHIGLLKVFEEQGIRINYLTGSSMGGIIAAAYAAGRTPAEMETEARRMSKARNLMGLIDLAPGKRGLMEGKKVHEFLATLIGRQMTFQQTRFPLALTAVDICTGQLVVLEEGSLVDAAQATMTVPGLFKPFQWGEASLIDGGILNNLPVDIVRQMGADISIAVDVTPDFQAGFANQCKATTDAWPAFLPSFARDFYIAELIMTSALTGYHLRASEPELVIRPHISPEVSIFWGFSHVAETIAAGEKAARDALPSIIEIVASS